MRSRTQSKRSRRGSILVAMLGLVALLAAMLVSFLAEASERIKYNGLLDTRADLRPDAYSALEIALAVLSEVAEIDDGLRATQQGWDDPLEYAGFNPFPEGYSVTFEFVDESSRLPLSQLGQDDLQLLFDEMGLPTRDAENLANTLLDWMDSNDLARLDSMDGDDYERMDPPYWPTNAVPQTWEEFALIDGYKELFWDEEGRPTPEFEMFRSSVSLINTGKVNINSAGPFTLRVMARMAGIDAYDIERDLAGYDRERGTADDLVITGNEDAEWMEQLTLATNEIDLLRVIVRVKYGDSAFMIDALVRYKGATPGVSASDGLGIESGWDLFPDKPASALGYPFEIVHLAENRRK